MTHRSLPLIAAAVVALGAAAFFIKGRLLDPSQLRNPNETPEPVKVAVPSEPAPVEATPVLSPVETQPTENQGYGKRGGRGGKDQQE
jgi:hypothetical protein